MNQEGIRLVQQGRLEEAASQFRAAVRVWPGYADGHGNLGNVLYFLGRFDEAAAAYREAHRLAPRDAAVLSNLSNVLRLMGRLDEAADAAYQALAQRPDLASAHSNLGSVRLVQNRFEEAALCFQQALWLKPTLAEAHCNLGATLRLLGRLDEAVACCREAIRLNPNFADARSHLGAALADRGDLDEATANLQTALRLNPALAWAHVHLGFVRSQERRFDEALACCQEALRLDPNNHEAHLHRAMIHLAQGDFEQGWAGYEWRWRHPILADSRIPQPWWDGAARTDCPLVLHAEQGWGDTFQFIRCAALAKPRVGDVTLLCPASAIPLLRSCAGIDRLASSTSAAPPNAVHASLLSLPRLFGTTLETIPAAVPYLFADPGLVEHWRRELAALAGFKIGVAWQGSATNAHDRRRSIPLACFEPLARTPGVQLVSLQIGKGSEAVRATAGRFAVTDLSDRLDRTSGAFMDTAAVMKGLDLVIACDTSVVHLAGALGVPVWTALSFAPDWRWLLDRDDSPWYPTMRLFRQSRPGDWGDVFARMAEALRPLAANR
ncbi:MAG TPA: tetratricopeptide repeat-containing glycosyltransferase family protein [Gemmataceae bacterium]|nr:tetratricopeptide repeat-containing glycosyltransferase family protein [Gemmataceae bacterium]